MKVLIIGGTKFIGKSIVDQSLKNGYDVVLFNRGKRESGFKGKVIKGDIENILNYKKEILNHGFDIVVHCIAYTEKHGMDVRAIFRGTNVKLILISSCDSYEVFQGLNRQKDLAELPVDEKSQLSSMKYYWSDSSAKGSLMSLYDKNLLADVLFEGYRSEEFELTVFKLPMVYGPGDHQYPNRHGAFIQRILDKKNDLILSDREQCQVYTYGYIDNIGAAIVYSFNKEITNGKIYNIGEEKSRSARRWAELYAKMTNWTFNFHIIPEELIVKDKAYRNAPPQHLLTDSRLYERETGFKNPVSLEDAIGLTFDYGKKNPEVLGEKPDYIYEKKLIEVYYSSLDQIHNKLIKA